MKVLSTRYFRGWHVVAVLVVAFALLPLMPARRGRAQAPTTTYTIIDLGTLGGTDSVAYGINNCAQVVGDSSLTGSSPKHPFIWTAANGMQDLGTFAGGSGTASAINSSAQVAGDSVNVDPLAFGWQQPGPIQSLGTLPGDVISLAYDINDTSQIVGLSESASLTSRAFIWQNSVMTAVPTLNSVTPMIARGVNNGGQIVGIATNLRAFVHTGSTNIDLGTFGGTLSIAYEIGDDNRVVGYADMSSNNANVPRRAFVWHDANSNNLSDPGELKNLGTLGGTHSAAYDINSSTYVVGSADISSGADPRRAFIWHDANGDGDGDDLDDAGEMRNLNELLAPASPSWTLMEARSINDVGQIVGWGLISGQVHAFLLTPTGGVPPSPCSLPGAIQFSSATYNVSESATTATITVTRTGGIANGASVQYTTSDGSATTAGSDYTLSSGTLTFAQGEISKTFTVSITNDAVVEPDETVNLTLSNPGGGATLGSPSTAVLTITNDDAAVPGSIQFSASTYNVNEGSGPASITITRTGGSNGAVSVSFSTTTGGTATANTDYTVITNQTVSFADGDAVSKTVTVPITNDSIDEPGETVNLAITGATGGATLGTPNTAVLTIDDNDGPPAFSINHVTLAEGNSGTTAFTFTVTKTGTTALASSVNFATADGTATIVGSDYASNSGTLNFSASDTSLTITVNVNCDAAVEANETFFVNLSNPTNATISASQGTGTINNDDTEVTVAVLPSSVAEDGAANLVYTFTRTGVTSGPLTVNFSVGGSATFGTDYTAPGTMNASSGTISFNPTETTKTVTIDPTTDAIDEPDETVILTVVSGSGYLVGTPSSAPGTITDDDGTPSISITDVIQTEGDGGSTSVVFTVSLSPASQSTITVDYATGAGVTNPATGGVGCGTGTDFVSTSGTLTFVPSDTSKQINVLVCGDTALEADETFFVNLFGATNATISDNQGLGTITNDDTDVTVAVSPSSVTETGATNLVYTFTRTGVTSGALTINFSVGGTATTGTDYSQSGAATFTSSNGTVTFAPASTTAIVSVDPTPDALVETSETVTLTVTSGTGYNVASPDAATGTITDAPMIFTEVNTNNAVAIDSVTFVRGPFRIVGDNNFSADHRTRVMLFTSNLGLSQPDSSQLTVQIAGVNLEVEKVGQLTGVPGLDASFIIVRLADNVPTGVDLQLVLTLRGVQSNTTLISISP